mmetsp:Transcript_28881/g.35571  ORF Transcript_28881/g.35571 Transcript_28881/m.35571 type:complete len:553 (+) Transcript_28881:769-2427(+)
MGDIPQDPVVQHRRGIVLKMHEIGCEIQRVMGREITEELNHRIWTSCQDWEDNYFEQCGSNINDPNYRNQVHRKILQLQNSLAQAQQKMANTARLNMEKQLQQQEAMREFEKQKRERERKMRLEQQKRLQRQKRLEEQKRLQAQRLAEERRRAEEQRLAALKQQQLNQAYHQYETRRKQMGQEYLRLLQGIKHKLTSRRDPADAPRLKFVVAAEKVLVTPAVKDFAKLQNGTANLNKVEKPLHQLKQQWQQRQMQQQQQQMQQQRQMQQEHYAAQTQTNYHQRSIPASNQPKRRRALSKTTDSTQSNPWYDQISPTPYEPVTIILDDDDDTNIISPAAQPETLQSATRGRERGVRGRGRGKGKGAGTRGKGKGRGRGKTSAAAHNKQQQTQIPPPLGEAQEISLISSDNININPSLAQHSPDIIRPANLESLMESVTGDDNDLANAKTKDIIAPNPEAPVEERPATPVPQPAIVKPTPIITESSIMESSTPLVDYIEKGLISSDGFGFTDPITTELKKDTENGSSLNNGIDSIRFAKASDITSQILEAWEAW